MTTGRPFVSCIAVNINEQHRLVLDDFDLDWVYQGAFPLLLSGVGHADVLRTLIGGEQGTARKAGLMVQRLIKALQPMDDGIIASW